MGCKAAGRPGYATPGSTAATRNRNAQHQHALADQTVRHGVERFLELHAPVRADAQLLAHHRVAARHRERSQGLGFLALEQLQRSATDLLDDMLIVALTIPALQFLTQFAGVGGLVPALLLGLANASSNDATMIAAFRLSGVTFSGTPPNHSKAWMWQAKKVCCF